MSAPGYVSPPRRLASSRRRRQVVSLTPLIDLVFILLVFFMLASSFMDWRAITLDAPATASGEPSGDSTSLLVELRAEGAFVDGERLSGGALEARVRQHLGENPEAAVFVRPSEGVALQRAITLIDRLSAAGAQNLSLTRDAATR